MWQMGTTPNPSRLMYFWGANPSVHVPVLDAGCCLFTPHYNIRWITAIVAKVVSTKVDIIKPLRMSTEPILGEERGSGFNPQKA